MIRKWIGLIMGVAVFALFSSTSCIQRIDTGHVGVLTSFGDVQDRILEPGLNAKLPWHRCTELDCRTQKVSFKTECFSKDLQQVEFQAMFAYRLDKEHARRVFATIGEEYVEQVLPRVMEAMKQEVAKYNAEELVAKRNDIRENIIANLAARVCEIVSVDDVVISNIAFSDAYEKAIEDKQVAQQNALKAKYELERARIEAEKLVTIAEGEAKAINVRGQAIKDNPGVTQLEAIKKWNGVSPSTVVLGGGSTNVPVVFPVR